MTQEPRGFIAGFCFFSFGNPVIVLVALVVRVVRVKVSGGGEGERG